MKIRKRITANKEQQVKLSSSGEETDGVGTGESTAATSSTLSSHEVLNMITARTAATAGVNNEHRFHKNIQQEENDK